MQVQSIQTKVDFKYFKQKAIVHKELSAHNSDAKYILLISHNETPYILKGHKINIEHLVPGNPTSAETFAESLTRINEVYQEYFFGRFACLSSPHIAKPLFIDHVLQLAQKKGAHSFMCIETIFEYGGEALDKPRPIDYKTCLLYTSPSPRD
eukprot:TRINITY_DN1804_c0_g3_i1.p2 TRINITY_DN1804_c0_g3~~TRINITY_DN1804_c0_g3_i1.p2  ORF type:complete len:152 (+),score=34.91 TRINITY_DN1804_c0_g3_i1:188-643(+)